MTPFRITYALLLLAVAFLLAAGCAGEADSGPPGKYVYVEHVVEEKWTTLNGSCSPMVLFDGPTYSFDERTGRLSTIMCRGDELNASLRLVYAGGYRGSGGAGGGARTSLSPVYSVPRHFDDGVTILSADSVGSVRLEYHNTAITLRPGEHRVFNTTRVIDTHEPGCTKEINITDNFSGAGLFDQQKIHATYLKCLR